MKRTKPKAVAFRHVKTKGPELVNTGIKITKTQRDYFQNKKIELSPLVRSLLDEEIIRMGGLLGK